MIDCLQFQRQWGNDGLDAADALLMRFHMSVCDRCQDYDQQMRAERSLKVLTACEENPIAEESPVT